MKEFAMKHPFITFLIVDEISNMIQNLAIIVKGNDIDTKMSTTKQAFRDCCIAAERIAESVKETQKEPMGFHFNKEEA